MNRMKAFAISSCLALLAVAFMPSSKADQWNKKTDLTINAPVAVPGKVLEPGKYVMRLLDSQSNRHIVQIFNEDESKLQTTILAIPNYRLQPTGDTQFSFWETPAGQPRALKAWFYPGDNFGQEFAYPKEMATTIARANNENVPTAENEKSEITQTTPSGEAQAMGEAQSAQAQPNTDNENSVRTGTGADMNNNANANAEPPQETAQAAPPSEPANQSAQTQTTPSTSTGMSDSAATQTAQNRLPRTASPFPLVGLAGLFSLGAAVAARVLSKQSA